MDNATVSTVSKLSDGGAAVQSGQGSKQATSKAVDIAGKKVVNSKGQLEDRPLVSEKKPQATPTHTKGSAEDAVGASKSEGSQTTGAKSTVGGAKKRVERRSTAEGARRYGHSRASTRRASHSMVRMPETKGS